MLKCSKIFNIKRTFFYSKSTMCDVAVCQFTATNNKKENLETVKKLTSEAAEKGAKMAFLPEGCDFIGGSTTEIQELAESLEGPTMKEYKDLATKLKIWLSIGGFHERDPDSDTDTEKKIFNSHVLINENGELVSIYRKLHLFDVFLPEKNRILEESKYVTKGTQITPPVDSPAGPLSQSICYDLRFPELSTIQRKKGSLILTYPSAFTALTGKAHWETLLRSRAIENQCYVIAAAQYGKHNEKRFSHGQSMIVDPWGKIIAQCPAYTGETDRDESIAIAKIEPHKVDRVRKEMPVFNHRRNDVYQLKDKCNDFVQLSPDDEFKFSDKSIPESTVFLKTELSYAFTNLRCVVPGHVLVSTLRVVPRLENCTPEEISDLFSTVVKVQKVVETHYGATSSTICCQDGKEAGQTVQHVHVHILPRKVGDFENNDDIYERLASHDKNNEAVKLRDLSEMTEEAQLLKKYFYSNEFQCSNKFRKVKQ